MHIQLPTHQQAHGGRKLGLSLQDLRRLLLNDERAAGDTSDQTDAGSGKRAGKPARREGLAVGPDGRRKTGRRGGAWPCSQGRTWGLETGVREASLSVPNTHRARTATAAELLEPQWAGEGQLSRTRAEVWVNCHVPLARRQQSPGDQG